MDTSPVIRFAAPSFDLSTPALPQTRNPVACRSSQLPVLPVPFSACDRRIAESCERRKRANRRKQRAVIFKQLLRRIAARIAPSAIGGRRERNTPKFTEHDWLGTPRFAVNKEHTAARPFPVQQSRFHLVLSVAMPDSLRLVVIIMDADDIGRDAFPPVVADNRASWIQRLREMIQRLDVIALRRAVGQIRHAPRLIERYPSHNARMAAVALQHFHPLLGYALNRFARVAIGARHLLPDQ